MWIERLEFLGFGDSINEKIELSHDVLNLIEEHEGQLLIPAAVLGVLYGMEKTNEVIPAELSNIIKNQPSEETKTIPFVATIVCNYAGRWLNITRNFETNALTVYGDNDNQKDLSSEWSESDLVLGERLTHLTCEEFVSKCVIVYEQSPNDLSRQSSIREALANIVNGRSPAYAKATAIQVLENYLNQFPYKAINIKVDFLIEELEKQKLELSKKLTSLGKEREETLPLLTKSVMLTRHVDSKLMELNAQSYLNLCLRTAEIDNQVLKLKAQHVRCRNMEEELSKLSNVDSFVAYAQSKVEELWKNRTAKIDSYQTLAAELTPKIERYESQENAVTRRWEKLQSFTPEQAHILRSMADRFAIVQRELNSLKMQQETQERGTKQSNNDLSKYEEAKQTMLRLDAQDANDAKSYCALISGFRRQLAGSERGKSRADAIVREIEEQRRAKMEANAVLKILKPAMIRQPELDAAQADSERHRARMEDLRDKIENLEQRLQVLADKAGIGEASKLVEYIQEYATADPQLLELEKINQAVQEKKALFKELADEFVPYFEQAECSHEEINGQSAAKLAESVLNCLRDFKALNNTFSSLKLAKQQLEILAEEIKTVEAQLEDIFSKTGLAEPSNIDASYKEFYGKLAKYHDRLTIEEELAKVKEKYGFSPGSSQIHHALAELEFERRRSWQKMYELADHYPEIGELPPSRLEEMVHMPQPTLTEEEDILRQEKEDIQKKLRSFFDAYDEQYPLALSRISGLDGELQQARNAKLALELAREVLEQLLMNDLVKASLFDKTEEEPLPLIIDARSLTEDELGLSLSLRFLVNVIASKRQTILLSSGRKLTYSKFSSTIDKIPDAVNVAWRVPIQTDKVLKRALAD